MAILAVLAFLLHALVVTRGAFYLATTKSRRVGDKEIVLAISTVSALHMVARVVVWIHPHQHAGSLIAATLFTAYAVATASIFLALINCYTKAERQRHKRRTNAHG